MTAAMCPKWRPSGPPGTSIFLSAAYCMHLVWAVVLTLLLINKLISTGCVGIVDTAKPTYFAALP